MVESGNGRNGTSSTELGANISDLVGGPETCPACGAALRDDHLVERDGDFEQDEDNVTRGKDTGKRAQKLLVCTDVGGGQIVVETEDGIEEMTSDYRLENGFDEVGN